MCHKVWNPNRRTAAESLAILEQRATSTLDLAVLDALTERARVEGLIPEPDADVIHADGAVCYGDACCGDPEPFELIAEVHDTRTVEPDATLTFEWSDQSFTRPVSRRERAMRMHAQEVGTRDTESLI